jgi:hypothetical protein
MSPPICFEPCLQVMQFFIHAFKISFHINDQRDRKNLRSSRHQTDVLNQLHPEGIVINLEVINEKRKDAVDFTTWNRRTDRELRIDGLQKPTDSSVGRSSPESKSQRTKLKDTVLDF